MSPSMPTPATTCGRSRWSSLPRFWKDHDGTSCKSVILSTRSYRTWAGIRGPQPGTYLLTGPDFRGDIPGGMVRIASRTSRGPLGTRIFVSGEADLPAAVEPQKGFQAIRLSAYCGTGLPRAHLRQLCQPHLLVTPLRHSGSMLNWVMRCSNGSPYLSAGKILLS
jgi:hypothetical protein